MDWKSQSSEEINSPQIDKQASHSLSKCQQGTCRGRQRALNVQKGKRTGISKRILKKKKKETSSSLSVEQY
jgi:hypothetical protein